MVVGHERFWAGAHAYSDRTSYGCSTAPRALPCIIPDITYLHLCHTFRWSSFCTNPTSSLKGTSSKPVPKGSKTSLGSWSETRLFPLSRAVMRLCHGVSCCKFWPLRCHVWHLASQESCCDDLHLMTRYCHVRSHLRYAAHTINRPKTWMKWMWYWDFSKVIFIRGITWQQINMLCEYKRLLFWQIQLLINSSSKRF